MMVGPSCTPYEDGLFFFEIQLPNDYPVTPPRVHFLSFCSDRLNPNLYEDGKVCVSLLGTWTGRVRVQFSSIVFALDFSTKGYSQFYGTWGASGRNLKCLCLDFHL
jgi:ubiquitin-protein ligase